MKFNCKVVLGSSSPRRKDFFKAMGVDVEIRTKEVKEDYPKELTKGHITYYLARLKAQPLLNTLTEDEVLITSDTIVWFENRALGKPTDYNQAVEMLEQLSGNWHEVYTSVCFSSKEKQELVNAITRVKFNDISREDIQYYIDEYQPFDKAGAYGIQEWIGLIAVEKIEGSYNNVVGLPTALVYKTLTKFCNS